MVVEDKRNPRFVGTVDQRAESLREIKVRRGQKAFRDSLFRDGSTSKPIGTISVDKNSWVLGGMLATTQTADSYMPGAAKKVAAEAKPFGKGQP